MASKTAFITNVTDYAGLPIAAAYADAGWTVFCHDDDFSTEDARRAYESAHPRQHASAAGDAEAFVAEGLQRFERIDALISNDIPKMPKDDEAATGGAASLLGSGNDLLAGFEDYVDSLLLAPIRLLRAALPSMKTARTGSIVLVTSGSPLRSPPMTIPHGYPAARAAANFLVKSLAAELAADGIQVNAVAPYLLYSQTMFPSEIGADDPKYVPLVEQLVPMKRFGAPEEIGTLVFRLTSGEMQFVSGQIIAFSGAAC